MSKRRDGTFPKRKHDKYYTPESAVRPLVDHLPEGVSFVEPCAGNGQLVRALEAGGFLCTAAYDIDPEGHVGRKDAFALTVDDCQGASLIITNPPWTRELLHPMIEHFRTLRDTWLLFDADWMHTRQASPYLLTHCSKIVSVGRVKWIPGSKSYGMDNVAWYFFPKRHPGRTEFFGR